MMRLICFSYGSIFTILYAVESEIGNFSIVKPRYTNITRFTLRTIISSLRRPVLAAHQLHCGKSSMNMLKVDFLRG